MKIAKIFQRKYDWKPDKKINFTDKCYVSKEYSDWSLKDHDGSWDIKSFMQEHNINKHMLLIGRDEILSNRVAVDAFIKTSTVDYLLENKQNKLYRLSLRLDKYDEYINNEQKSSWKLSFGYGFNEPIEQEICDLFKKIVETKVKITNIFMYYRLANIHNKVKNFNRKELLDRVSDNETDLSEIWIAKEDAIKHGFTVLEEVEI